MGDLDDALERADREAVAFTRRPPKGLKARINFLMGQAEIDQRRGRRARRQPALGRAPPHRRAQEAAQGDHRPDRIDAAVRAGWQPQVRGRRRQQAATRAGITVETRARFGYTAPVGTTDDGRMRRLTVHLPPASAQRLFGAQRHGAGDERLRAIAAEGLQEVYFKDGGGRADHLEAELTDIGYIDVAFQRQDVAGRSRCHRAVRPGGWVRDAKRS